MNIEGTTPPAPVVAPDLKCHECGRPRELKVDKSCSLAGKTKGVRVRPMATQANRGRRNSRLRKRDPRDVHFY